MMHISYHLLKFIDAIDYLVLKIVLRQEIYFQEQNLRIKINNDITETRKL